jgi:gamma-carbonic anhydrase
VNPSTTSISIENQKPELEAASFVAPNVCIAGDVVMGKNASAFYGVSIRANGASVRIGANTSVLERACVMATTSPCVIGSGVTIGANAQVHSCKLNDECVVGSNAKVLNGSVVERHAVVTPGSFVPENQVIPAGQLWSGTPASYVRDLTAEEIDIIKDSAMETLELAEAHAFECEKTFEEMELEKEELEFEERKNSPHYFDPDIEAGRSGRIYSSNN